MATDTKISVIIPIYNAEQTLRRCVDSILAQTFTDYELILVNDGSTDASATICDQYTAIHPNVRAINKANGGVSSARNAGIRAARGEYLSFVDADDEVTPSFLTTFAKQGMGGDLCIQSMTLVSSQGERKEVCLSDRLLTGHDSMLEAILDILRKQLPVSACYSLFRRKLIEEKDLLFDEKIVLCEDTDFMLRYLQHCHTMQTLSAPNYIYYQPVVNKNYHNKNGLYTCLRLLREINQLTSNEALRQAFRRRYYLRWATEELFYYQGEDKLYDLAKEYGQLCQPYLHEYERENFRHRLFKHLCISPHPRAIIFTARLVMGLYQFLRTIIPRPSVP